MTNLSTLVEPLKRELAVPGVFDDVFPDTDDRALADSLADAFGEAQLQGFFTDMTLGASPTYDTSQALSAAGGALIVLVAGQRIIRAQLRNLVLNTRYKAGAAEMELQRSATLLKEELAYLRTRMDELVTTARRSGGRTVYMLDNYLARDAANSPLGGFYGYEYKA
jgi:hypothetical protein